MHSTRALSHGVIQGLGFPKKVLDHAESLLSTLNIFIRLKKELRHYPYEVSVRSRMVKIKVKNTENTDILRSKTIWFVHTFLVKVHLSRQKIFIFEYKSTVNLLSVRFSQM